MERLRGRKGALAARLLMLYLPCLLCSALPCYLPLPTPPYYPLPGKRAAAANRTLRLTGQTPLPRAAWCIGWIHALHPRQYFDFELRLRLTGFPTANNSSSTWPRPPLLPLCHSAPPLLQTHRGLPRPALLHHLPESPIRPVTTVAVQWPSISVRC